MKFRPQNIAARVALTFKKKPVDIQAERLTKDESLDTLEGEMQGKKGDWKATGVEGEQWFIKDSIFEKTYEPVDDEAKEAWEAAYGSSSV